MSTPRTALADAPRKTSVGDVLGPQHQRWLPAVEAAVHPALLGTSTLWDRWGAARYLEERLAPRLEQELALARLLPELPRQDLEHIESDYARLEQLRAGIEAAGSRHHTGGLIMTVLEQYLGVLTGWWVDLEQATARISLAALPAAAVGVLRDLEGDSPRTVEPT